MPLQARSMVLVRNPQGRTDPSSPAGDSLVVDTGGGGTAAREVDGSGGQLRVHLALPAGNGPWPGVVLVPAGSTGRAWKRQLCQARRLADQGFVVVIPEPASLGPARSAGALLGRLFGPGGTDQADGTRFDQVEAARTWLAGQSACTGAVSVVGLR